MRSDASEFLQRSIQHSSLAGLTSAWGHWLAFLASLDPPESTDPFLFDLSSDADRVLRVVLFARHRFLFHDERNEQVKDLIGRVCRCFEISLIPTIFFADPLISRAKRSAARDREEKSVYLLRQDAKHPVPLCGSLAWRARDHFWSQPLSSSSCDLTIPARWISLALAMNNGLRPSNVTLADGPDSVDHCIRGQDLSFGWSDSAPPCTGTSVTVLGASALRARLGGDRSRSSRVLWCKLRYCTSKTESYNHFLKRRSVPESAVLDDLCRWIILSSFRDEDEVVTRYLFNARKGSYDRKVVSNRDFRSVLSWIGESAGLGADAFSAKSIRGGFATSADLDGLNLEEINRGGGWAPKSVQAIKTYAKKSRVRGSWVGVPKCVIVDRPPSGKPEDWWARMNDDATSSLTEAMVNDSWAQRNASRQALVSQSRGA